MNSAIEENQNRSNDPSFFDLPTHFGSRKHYKHKTKPNFTAKSRNDFSYYRSRMRCENKEFFSNCPLKKYFFEKKKDLKILPCVDNVFHEKKWKLPDLQEFKNELNSVKSELNDFNLEEWHKHTKLTYKSARVQPHLKANINPELLTQAWCKFYEILHTFQLVPNLCRESNAFNSVHLCEAPGAFVSSLNHYLNSKHLYSDVKWDWMAVTLNPYHEHNCRTRMINDDRLIFYTLPKWNFGEDGTGDIQVVENMKCIVSDAHDKFQNGVMLVTCDGSVDCTLDPAEQESIVSPLFYCEAITALHLLRRRGILVLKLFTLFECETICLLYLLYCSFDSLKLFKPLTSKDGNSEVYLVCEGYEPTESLSQLMPKLTSHYGPKITEKAAMFRRCDIPDSFLAQVFDAAKLFQQEQLNAIRLNISRFNKMTLEEKNQLHSIQEEVAHDFVQYYQVGKCFKELVGSYQMRQIPNLTFHRSVEDGSYNENKDRLSSLCSWLNYAKQYASNFVCKWPSDSGSLCIFTLHNELPEISYTFGKRVDTVNSSKFCSSSLLEIFNKINQLLDKQHRTCVVASTDSMVCDVSKEYMNMEVWKVQRYATESIFERLQKMKEGDSLQLIGLPLLTQYDVSLTFLLGHLFDSVCFFKPSGSPSYKLQFEGFIKERFQPNILEVLDKIGVSNEKSALLTLFPIPYLCSNKDLYSCIVAMNHIFLKEYISKYITMVS